MKSLVNKLYGCFLQQERLYEKLFLCCLLLLIAKYIGMCFDRKSSLIQVTYYNHERYGLNLSWKAELRVNFTWNSVLDSLQHIPGKGDFLQSDSDELVLKHQGKSSNLDKEILKVFVLFHSHNDPGYLQTFDEYYFRRTKQILSLAVENLMKHPDLTFIWTDTCFLERWWNEQDNITRDSLKHVVKTGQLEIALGAWVSADECVSHYFAYVDQLTEGYNWVWQHLGVLPNVSFNMDQFGSSATINYIRSSVGIKHSVVNHLHKGTKTYFRKHQLLEFHSRQLWGKAGTDDSFIHVEPFDNLAFRGSCGPSPFVCRSLDQRYLRLPNAKSLSFQLPKLLDGIPYKNMHHFVRKLVEQLKIKSSGYLHKALLLPLGHDNTYHTSSEWDNQYRNMKIIMEYINTNKNFNVHMKFGTLSQFFAEINKQSSYHNIQYPYVSGDLFPYTRGAKYWSGYFATRQFAKRLGRELQESIRAADMLLAFLTFSEMEIDSVPDIKLVLSQLLRARRVLYIFQHHDAITGTSEEDVAKDYRQQLSSGFTGTQDILAQLIKVILYRNCVSNDTDRTTNQVDPLDIRIAPTLVHDKLNELTRRTLIDINGNKTKLIVFNSFPQKRSELITVLTKPTINVQISDLDGIPIKCDIETSESVNKLTFVADLPPVSLSVFKLAAINQVRKRQINVSKQKKHKEIFVCQNNAIVVTHSLKSGSPLTMCLKNMNSCIHLQVSLIHYPSGSDVWTFPDNGKWEKIEDYSKYRSFTGEHSCSVDFLYKYVHVKFLLHKGVGINEQRLAVHIHDNLSKGTTTNFVGDLAVRIQTSIRSRGMFYTDSNGLQLMKRIYRSNLSFGGNIYPMTSMAVIEDNLYRLTVHATQPHGVVSRESGSLDIMVDRVVVTEGDGTVRNFLGNTKDNSPTFTKLYFQLEDNANQINGTEKDGLAPSVNSVIINDLIQHPIYSFYSHSELTYKKYKHEFLNKPPPPEISIANLKCLIGDDLSIDGLTVTLFRREVSKGSLQNQTIAFNPSSLFMHYFKSVGYMFKNRQTLSGDNYLFNPLELKTFVLK